MNPFPESIYAGLAELSVQLIVAAVLLLQALALGALVLLDVLASRREKHARGRPAWRFRDAQDQYSCRGDGLRGATPRVQDREPDTAIGAATMTAVGIEPFSRRPALEDRVRRGGRRST